jgi:hypothetical protein
MGTSDMMRRLRGDRGQVAGIEAVPFGLLVLAVGILLVAHTWAVVDAKFVAVNAAREAGRAFVEARSAVDGAAAARRAVDEVAGRSGRPASAVTLRRTSVGFGRCVPARFEAGLEVPAVGAPWRPDRPTVLVRARHEEVVDPYRDDLAGLADCPPSP